jgi:RNA polymerase sigma-70 factor (ECF subfamily)
MTLDKEALERGRTPAPPSSPPEERSPLSRETLERVRERQPRALSQLFEFYFERIYGLAFRLLGDRPAAEDVTQDVFQKVYRAADQLDPDRDPGPWLLAITHNLCRDLWRSRAYKLSRRSQSIEDSPFLAQTLPAPGNAPDDVVSRLERAQRVQEAILKLPEPYRSVVVLHDYRGLSHEEIAVATGASYAAVRKRYSRALAKLGDLLKDVLA